MFVSLCPNQETWNFVSVGSAELKATWTDPDFNPNDRAFYYVRVLENPTCRWSTWDAIKRGLAPRPDIHDTIQERAWSSPIWFVPTGSNELAPAQSMQSDLAEYVE